MKKDSEASAGVQIEGGGSSVLISEESVRETLDFLRWALSAFFEWSGENPVQFGFLVILLLVLVLLRYLKARNEHYMMLQFERARSDARPPTPQLLGTGVRKNDDR